MIILVCVVGAAGAPNVWSDTLAAVVNGRPLARWEVERELVSLVTSGSFHTNIAPEKRAELERGAFERLVLKELKKQWGEEVGVEVDQAAVETAFTEVRERFANDRVFQAALDEKGISDVASFRRAFERDVVAEAVDEYVRSQVSEPTAEEVEVYFILHRDEYVRPEARHIVHVLLPVKPQADRERWEQTRQQAEGVVRQAREGGLSLLEAGTEFIQHIAPQLRDQVGDLGFVHRGTLHPDLDREAFSVRVGEVTAPVPTIFGYHVLQVLDVRPPEPIEFDDAREAIKNTLTDQRRAEALASFEHVRRAAAKIEVADWGE